MDPCLVRRRFIEAWRGDPGGLRMSTSWEGSKEDILSSSTWGRGERLMSFDLRTEDWVAGDWKVDVSN